MIYKKTLPIILFIVISSILLITAYPAIGWWDSGYYAACANGLGIPGQGGSILYVLLGRVFALVFFFLPKIKAIVLTSIASTALTAVFFYFTLIAIFQNMERARHSSLAPAIAFVTALALPFLYSIWIEAHVTRVYTLGLFLTSVLVFCSVKMWYAEDADQKIRLFLLIVFLLGIDFGAHRLNMPFIPVALVLLILPLRKHLTSAKFWTAVLIVLAFSLTLHAYLLVRAQLNPPADTGNTHTWAQLMAWIGMEQFGSESNFLQLFNRHAPLWDYQIKFMYLRYFGWNFLGKGGLMLPGLPLLLGLVGFLYTLARRFKTWLIITLPFAFYSTILIFYLNVVDGFHNIREIDRLFLPSFLIFLIWVGIGLYNFIGWGYDLLSKFSLTKNLAAIALPAIAFAILPLNLIVSNWRDADKSNYFFPADFAHNILSSCDQHAVLFTNGDNDTYPLWYLQQVEGFRTDVAVANVNLLNLRFYIEQLAQGENSVPFDSTFLATAGLTPSRLDTPLELTLAPPTFPVDGMTTDDSLTFTFSGHNLGGTNALLVQDKAMLSFLFANAWQRPVYFCATVAPQNLLGLQDYLAGAGIVCKLVPAKDRDILPDILEENLLQKYRYRSFDDPKVQIEGGIVAVYGNFRTAFLQLANHYFRNGIIEKAREIFKAMNEKLPQWRFSESQNVVVKNFEKMLYSEHE